MLENQEKNKFLKYFILIILVAGFITTFISGYILGRVTIVEKKIYSQITPTQKPIPTIDNIQVNTLPFLPGKFYFDDTIIAITKTKPLKAVAVSARRLENENGYLHNTGLSFFNGENWSRETESAQTSDTAIPQGKLINSWDTQLDPSRVLKQAITTNLSINETLLSIETGTLSNEISLRSLPGYTKFMSAGNGKLTINEIKYEVYILYTQIYSFNSSDIAFYNQPLDLTTDWVGFWDEERNFYHIDITRVKKPIPTYQTHTIGVMKDMKGNVLKTFTVNVQRNSEENPEKYSIFLNSPINTTLQFSRMNTLDKAVNNNHIWLMGIIEGSIISSTGRNINGIGLVEYIHEK